MSKRFNKDKDFTRWSFTPEAELASRRRGAKRKNRMATASARFRRYAEEQRNKNGGE